MSVTYRTAIAQTGNNTGIPVPDAVLDELGAGRRPKVVADIDGYVFSTTVGSMGGTAMLSFSKAHREASGYDGGREVSVTIALDHDPGSIVVPDDLAGALAASPEARAFFDSLAPSYQRNFVDRIEEAKQAPTRRRRIAATIEKLEVGQKR